jgi:hypothetical protein
MSKAHNKKRNVALLYEFLVQSISRALIDGDRSRSSRVLKILKKHFKPGTELYKEFRLANSLVKTTVSSEAVAIDILREARSAARSLNVFELNKQKSFLIKDINYKLNDENFYDQQVGRYKTLATIQTLINDWREQNCDISKVAQYEDQLVRWLVTEKEVEQDRDVIEDSPGTGRLLMKVMMKKLNEKYAGVLNDGQRALIKAYAFSTASDDPGLMKMKLNEVRTNLLSSIDVFVNEQPSNDFVVGKLNSAREQLLAENLEGSIDDEVITRFMLYAKLVSELESREVENG